MGSRESTNDIGIARRSGGETPSYVSICWASFVVSPRASGSPSVNDQGAVTVLRFSLVVTRGRPQFQRALERQSAVQESPPGLENLAFACPL